MVEQRAGSPTKVKDQAFITSLKAQGFEETSSKSKLVYNFEKKEEEERSNYADNFFLKNDEASKVGRDTIGRRNFGGCMDLLSWGIGGKGGRYGRGTNHSRTEGHGL